MAKDVQWADIEIPIMGVDEHFNERVLAPGQFVNARNGDWGVKKGAVQKRPGLRRLCYSEDTTAGPVSATRLVPHDDQLLVVDLRDQDVNPAYPASPGVFQPALEAGVGYVRVAEAVAPTVEKKPLASDLQNDIYCDMAVCENAAGTHWHVFAMVLLETGEFVIKIVERESGTVFYEALKTDTDTVTFARATVGLAPTTARPSYALLSYQTTNGKIKGFVVNCSGSSPIVSSRHDIATDGVSAATGWFHDTATGVVGFSPLPNWTVFYPRANDMKVRYLQNDMTTLWEHNWGGNNHVYHAPAVLEHNGNIFFNWWDKGDSTFPSSGLAPGWYYRVLDTTGATVLTSTLWCGAAGGTGSNEEGGQTSGIAPCFNDSTARANDVVLFHSNYFDPDQSTGQPDGFWDQYITRFRRAQTDGTLKLIAERRGLKLWSKPWRDNVNRCYYAWCGTRTWNSLSLAPSAPSAGADVPQGYNWTGALIRFAEQELAYSDRGIDDIVQLVGSTSGYSLGAPLEIDVGRTGADSTVWGEVPQSTSYVWRDPNTLAPDFSQHYCVLNQRYVLGEHTSGPWEVNVRFDHPGRYSFTQFGGATYCTGGILTQWDGSRHHENGFLTNPNVNWTAETETTAHWPDGTGGSEDWGGHHVFYQVVYESVMASGERVRSATSALIDVAIPVDHKWVITLHIEPHTVTMRNYGDGVGGNAHIKPYPHTIAVIYRSSSPDGQNLHRAFEFEASAWDNLVSDPSMINPIIVTDDGATLAGNTIDYSGVMIPLSAHELIYNDSGELDNDHPFGGCTDICTHKERLWVCGGDDGELVWYSKERADGHPAEFSLGQQIRVPGRRVVGVRSLGDNLILLTDEGVYRIAGDGPDATGNTNSGGFTNPIPIDLSIGCTSPRSIVLTPDGLMFRAEQGLYLLNQALQLSWLGDQQVDTVDANEIHHFARTVPSQSQVRFSISPKTTVRDGYPVVIWNYDHKIWAYWTYFQDLDSPLEGPVQGNIARDMVLWNGAKISTSNLARPVYLFAESSTLYVEDGLTFADGVTDIDDGMRVRLHLETGWLSFGRLQGYKNLRKVGIMTEPAGSYGLRVQSYYNYSTSALHEDRLWNSYEIANIADQDGPGWLRMNCQYQRQPSIKLIIDEVESAAVLTSTNTADLVDTEGLNIIRLKTLAGASFSSFAVPESDSMTKEDLKAYLNAAFEAVNFDARAYVNSSNKIVLVSHKYAGNYLAVDSYADGSTLNRVIDLPLGGDVGTRATDDTASFALSSLSFEVGQIPGIRRLSALQTQ